MNNKRWFATLLVSSGLILSGCGGGGGGGGSGGSPSTPALSGTAATGAAINGGTVAVKCADNQAYPTAITNSTGSYSIAGIPSAAFPCALEVSYGTPAQTLHSYANANGTVNITPLTDLALALATSQAPADWFASFDGTTAVTALDTQAAALLASLDSKGFSVPSVTGNPFTTAFKADHTGWDKVLDQLQAAIEAGTGNYQDLVNLLKDNGSSGLDAYLPVAIIPTFNISGSISGISAGTVSWQIKIGTQTPVVASSGNGTNVSFASDVPDGSSYVITVTQQPTDKTCSLNNGAGTIAANVTNVTITCIPKTTDPGTGGELVTALKALSNNNGKVFEVSATGTGNNTVDNSQNAFRRGLRADQSYPRCDALGYTLVNEFEQGLERWLATLSIDSSTGAVTLENPADASKKITLSPGAANTTLTSPASMPGWTTWATNHPEATLYTLTHQVPYTLPGHGDQQFYQKFELSLGVIGGVVEAISYRDNRDPANLNVTEVPFCGSSKLMPALLDPLSPLKDLAGSYPVQHNYHAAAPAWSELSIGTDGALTFGGTGPSLAPADIKHVRQHRANEANNSADDRVWALTIKANKDITGDGTTNDRDLINLFLTNTGELRDVQYLIEGSTPPPTPVEVSVVDIAALLPAFDDTLAAQLSANGVVGKIDNVLRNIASDTFEANSLRASLKAQQGENYTPEVLVWTVVVALESGISSYDCAKLANANYTEIRFETNDDTYSSINGGNCEIVVSQVHKDGTKTTGMEGKFRALLWEAHSRRFVPAVGFFRYTAP